MIETFYRHCGAELVIGPATFGPDPLARSDDIV